MIEKNPKVYIILLNYNGYKDTIDCIKSLREITYNNYNIIVIDNCSTDNSEKYISDYIYDMENISIIQTGQNLGFSGGNNIGIKVAIENNADYVCLLNNDTEVNPDFLQPLVNSMENDSNIGICAGKIMYYDNPNVIWSAGGYINNIKSLGYHYEIDNIDQYEQTKKEVTFLTGCLQLIRVDVFKNVGLYDERYFLYMEDVDFCYRVSRYGYKLLYIPESKIYHKVSASTGGTKSPLVTYYLTRNRMLFNSEYQNNIFYKFIFYCIWMSKLVIKKLNKDQDYKYILEGIKDHIKKSYGLRKF